MILSVENLTFSYVKKDVLNDISFEQKRGTIHCLMGPNGSGKSTLLDCVMGINIPKTGGVKIDGKDVFKCDRAEVARLAAYIPQNHNVTFPYTVLEAVMMGRTAYVSAFGIPPKEDESLAMDAMKRVGIEGLSDRSYGSISGGELRLVLLARALCQDTPLILMDEPTAHLDYRNELIFLETLTSLVREDKISVLIATHAPEHAFYFKQKGIDVSAIFLKDGRINAMGDPDEVINAKRLEEVYGVKARIIESNGEKTIMLERSL